MEFLSQYAAGHQGALETLCLDLAREIYSLSRMHCFPEHFWNSGHVIFLFNNAVISWNTNEQQDAKIKSILGYCQTSLAAQLAKRKQQQVPLVPKGCLYVAILCEV